MTIRWTQCVLCDAPLTKQYQSGSYLCHPCLARLAELEREEAVRRIGPNWVKDGTCAGCGQAIHDFSLHPNHPWWCLRDNVGDYKCQDGTRHRRETT